jgi:hypothetical protein
MAEDSNRERCGKDKRHTPHWWKGNKKWCDGKVIWKGKRK